MNAFWLVAAVLVVLASAPVLWVLRRGVPRDTRPDARREENLAGYRQRLVELELQRQAGAIEDTDYQRAKVELDRRLLDDTGTVGLHEEARTAAGGGLAVWLGALAIPVVALVMYQGLGASDAIRLDTMLQQLAGDLGEEQRAQLQEKMCRYSSRSPGAMIPTASTAICWHAATWRAGAIPRRRRCMPSW